MHTATSFEREGIRDRDSENRECYVYVVVVTRYIITRTFLVMYFLLSPLAPRLSFEGH